MRALGLERNRISDRGVRTIWASPILAQLRYCGLNGNPCSELATQELTHQEMSHYEWLPTEHTRALEAELGPRLWPTPSDYGWPPTLDDLAKT